MSDDGPTNQTPLDYEPQPVDPTPGHYGGQVALGAVFTVIGVFVMVPACIFAGVAFTNSWDSRAGPAIALVLGAIGLGGLILIAVRCQGSPRRRGWALGIWLGLGVALLLEGLCFASLMR